MCEQYNETFLICDLHVLSFKEFKDIFVFDITYWTFLRSHFDPLVRTPKTHDRMTTWYQYSPNLVVKTNHTSIVLFGGWCIFILERFW